MSKILEGFDDIYHWQYQIITYDTGDTYLYVTDLVHNKTTGILLSPPETCEEFNERMYKESHPNERHPSD